MGVKSASQLLLDTLISSLLRLYSKQWVYISSSLPAFSLSPLLSYYICLSYPFSTLHEFLSLFTFYLSIPFLPSPIKKNITFYKLSFPGQSGYVGWLDILIELPFCFHYIIQSCLQGVFYRRTCIDLALMICSN